MGKKKQAQNEVTIENKEKKILIEEQPATDQFETLPAQAEKKEEINENKKGDDAIKKTVDSKNGESVEINSEVAEVETNPKKRVGNVIVEKKSKFLGLNKGLAITAIILGVIAIAVITFAAVNKLNNNVYHNVYLNGVSMEGKTESEVMDYVSSLNKAFKAKTLFIKSGEKEIIQITADSIDMSIDELKTCAKIMAYGRDDNLWVNNLNIVKAYFEKQEIDIIYCYSENKLTNIASEVILDIDGRVIDDSFTVDNDNNTLIITKGIEGKSIVVPEFKVDVLDALKSENVNEYQLVLEEAQPKELDIDVVYAQVAKNAKDAYVDNTVEPAVYHKHELGITFDKEELRTLLEKEENKVQGKSIKFKLTTTKPSVTIQDITKDLYRDTLGKYTSDYKNSDSNRASNVALGAKMLNGTIIMPGETFSFNKVMGDCGLASRGFKAAAVFKNGKVVQEIGGGICQISSTLYVAALYANMSIVSRRNHALPVGYVPASLDATVYYPYLDFKFKNTRNYPVKIVATTSSSRKLTISICGTKEDVEYEIVLTSKKTGSIAPKVQEQKDSSLALGKTKQIQAGSYGYTSVAYKTVKLNGKTISTTLLSEDSYGSTPKIIAVGTKAVNIYGE